MSTARATQPQNQAPLLRATANTHPTLPLTYAQVLASPPTTPKQKKAKPLPESQAIEENITAAEKRGTPSGGDNKNANEQPERTKNPEATGKNKRAPETEPATTPDPSAKRPSAPTSRNTGYSPTRESSVYQFDELDMQAFEQSLLQSERRYESPTSEDWRNLSVHANGSVASDDLGGAIVNAVVEDERDIEDFITDGIDRYGMTIPGKEADREEYVSRKRQRHGSPPPDTDRPKPATIRFRKYRPQGPGAHRTTSWQGPVPGDRPPAYPPPMGPPGSAADLHAGWLKSALPVNSPPRLTAEEKGKATAADDRAEHCAASAASIPWSALTADMDVDPMNEFRERPSMNIPTASPTPAGKRDIEKARPPGKALLAAWTLGQRLDAEGVATEDQRRPQVEVLPSFLTPRTTARETEGARRPQDPPEWRGTSTPPAPPGADGYGFTPVPEEGFPSVHQPHPEGLIEDLALSRVEEMWKQEEGTVLLVQVANVGHPDVPLRKPIHDEIHALIKHVTGETEFVPIAPQPEWVQPHKRTDTPKTWAVLGLGRRSIRNLVELAVLSSTWITLFFYERKLVIPRYLFTLTGYTTNHGNDIVQSIKAAFMDEPIFATIEDLVQSHPGMQHLAAHEAALEIAESVEVRIDQLGNGNMQAAVFCDPPTGCGETWKLWRSNIARMPFHSRYNPTATARRTELCLCCHSADHLTHKCPFPQLQGWNAPPALSRTYGRPRTAAPKPGGEHAEYQAMTTPQGGYRGRGRGTGFYRGGRGATPIKNGYYSTER